MHLYGKTSFGFSFFFIWRFGKNMNAQWCRCWCHLGIGPKICRFCLWCMVKCPWCGSSLTHTPCVNCAFPACFFFGVAKTRGGSHHPAEKLLSYPRTYQGTYRAQPFFYQVCSLFALSVCFSKQKLAQIIVILFYCILMVQFVCICPWMFEQRNNSEKSHYLLGFRSPFMSHISPEVGFWTAEGGNQYPPFLCIFHTFRKFHSHPNNLIPPPKLKVYVFDTVRLLCCGMFLMVQIRPGSANTSTP